MATNRLSVRQDGDKFIFTSNDPNIKQVFFSWGSWGTGSGKKEHPEFYGHSIEKQSALEMAHSIRVSPDDEMWQWDLTMELVKDLYKMIEEDLTYRMKSAMDGEWKTPKAEDDVLKALGNVIAGVPSEEFDDFTKSYIEAALWSTIDHSAEEDGREGEHLDDNFGVGDLSPESLAQIKADCAKFQNENKTLLDTAPYSTRSGYSVETLAGHDFWLTREGHGTGFWDRGLGDVGDALTKAAKAFGECCIEVGDDGQLHGF